MPTHIQIGDITPRIQFNGDGIQTRFDFPFPIFNQIDLEVYIDDVIQPVGFTVYEVGESIGGYIIFDVAPAINQTITMRRWLDISRTSDFQESGELRAGVLNDELDYQIAALQQVAGETARSLRLSPTDIATSLELPPTIERPGKYLAFDGAGALVAAVPPVGGEIVSAFVATLLDDLNAATARATLGMVIGTDVLAPTGDGSALSGIAGSPVGSIIDFAGTGLPADYLDCNGANISRATYADLFTAIGTTWGVGDGSTTFGLPDLRRRTTVGEGGNGTATLGNAVGNTGGAETHTLIESEMPSHTHTQRAKSSWHASDTARTGVSNTSQDTSVGETLSSGGDTSHNNMQPSAVVRKLIKAA